MDLYRDLPPDRELETVYERQERMRKRVVPLALAFVVFQVLVLGFAPFLLAYTLILVATHFATRGWYERRKAERLAKGPRFTREELLKGRRWAPRIALGGLGLIWAMLAVLIVTSPPIFLLFAAIIAPASAVILLQTRTMVRRYDEMLAEDRPERV